MLNWKNIPISEALEDIYSLQKELQDLKPQIDKEFEDFYTKTKKIALEADKLIKKQFDNDPSQLELDLDEYVSYSYSISQLVTDAQTFVNIYEVIHHIPKSKEISESDRTKYINIKVTFPRNLLAKLKVIEESLGRKISVGQSILKLEANRLLKG